MYTYYEDGELFIATIVDYNVPANELPVIIAEGYFLGEKLNKYQQAGYSVEYVQNAWYAYWN